MEEVWKDITLASDLHQYPSSSSRGVILQDFFSKDPPTSPPPPTLLTLSSVPPPPIQHLNLPSHSLHNAAKKRFQDFDRNSGDRRYKRMIKNLILQAYTNELELEVAHLVEENARLKEQQQQLYIAAAAAQHQKNKSLHRTSTAPF
ncbi:hypothetical protein BUALT_Bualt04G0043700 [Buddleja alternifolia]|uniref:Uncharacterized protein n=1 Tax=Buddleja alternifolia TaxID=168488 RepID=A0AAV6XWW7_9LAMI|nr:hypothetical protein BUALT_Bualt04G0043700 [Buddleja alternifolia]